MEDAAVVVEPRITQEVQGAVLLVGLSRARKKNAFDIEMLRGLSDALTRLDADPSLRVGVVYAHGSDFTSGLDLADVAPHLAQGAPLFTDGAIDPWGTQGRRLSKPLVVAVKGLCYTVGIELLLNAEVCIASADTRFSQMEVSRGIFPFGGGTVRWVERVGWGNAMRWMLTGDTLDAKEALRIGLVQEVAPPDEVLGRAIAMAERIAAQAPLGVAATLRSARLAREEGPSAALQALLPELRDLMVSEDAQEGLRSFLERRPADFQGR
ncbi:MAG: crotonase/enoyl-CoA hydratase family protein [Myxococcota bacterium]